MEEDDEGVLRNRLIYKDIIIKKIFKKYLQLVSLLNSPTSATSPQIQQTYTQLLNEFSLFELSIQKAQTISETCREESNYYEQLCKQREIEIENEKKEIIKLKETLDHEKKHRQYKEQYLALYKVINEKPSIEQTEKEIQKSQKELNDLSDQTNKTTSKLELRTKQFQLLLHTLSELEKNLDDDFIDNNNQNSNNNDNNAMATTNSDDITNDNANDNNDVDEVMKEGEEDDEDDDITEKER
ncbi:hypothetical protein DICPUDRAFT_30821 [Dictyostelium purpureum]|uniref:THO complex subunit 7 homolog n=1 Tax=Dictyostelium purpureum TaxID=5786 RepID=F0ZG22_DICPU|nr:uncharacterized protein DICPUDRAFT_30821 [Dictyostelium purpureum]EGC37106.1 hypothetical protein DICPUDRAFT_30821 [Dictyostelium purpureum]|eukprot:XP_003286387.1 hypothetical protein DICPUDRAFT_30821 [Dictyostelium purpureum]